MAAGGWYFFSFLPWELLAVRTPYKAQNTRLFSRGWEDREEELTVPRHWLAKRQQRESFNVPVILIEVPFSRYLLGLSWSLRCKSQPQH